MTTPLPVCEFFLVTILLFFKQLLPLDLGQLPALFDLLVSIAETLDQLVIQVAALRRISLAEVLAANRKNIKDIYDC